MPCTTLVDWTMPKIFLSKIQQKPQIFHQPVQGYHLVSCFGGTIHDLCFCQFYSLPKWFTISGNNTLPYLKAFFEMKSSYTIIIIITSKIIQEFSILKSWGAIEILKHLHYTTFYFFYVYASVTKFKAYIKENIKNI